MKCPYDITVSLLASGRQKTVNLNGFTPWDESVLTAEEKDRNYRYREFEEVESYVSLANLPAGIPNDTFDQDITYKYQAKEYVSFSSNKFPVKYTSATGSIVEMDYSWTSYTDCDNDGHDYVRSEKTITSTLTLNGGSPQYNVVTVDNTTEKEKDNGPPCTVNTTTDSQTVNSTGVFFEQPIFSTDYDAPTRVSASSIKYKRKDNNSLDWTGGVTVSWDTWIDYQEALNQHSEVITLMATEAETEFECGYGTPTTVDGEIYGQCGAADLSNRTFLLSKYNVNFDASYSDKNHNVTGVNVQHLSDVDIIVKIAKDLGKPAQIRVIGDIVEISQDTPAVETITPFDDTLSIGTEDASQSTATHHAWKYGKPSSWTAKLTAPTAGGEIYIRNLAVQVEEGSFFE